MTSNIRSYVEAANALLTDPERNRTVGAGPVRFELYHFALSLCSQKVRAVLAEKGAGYAAHDINLSLPHLANYDPAYVRLRILGGQGQRLVGGYTGRSSTETEGLDPAVVPTLVDFEERRVYVDSLRICRHVDAVVDNGTDLVPASIGAEVERELAIVDGMPHVAILYGAHPDVDFRPERLRQALAGVHDRKIAKIEQARSAAADDPALGKAFDAKLRKERAGKAFVGSPDRMRRALTEMLDTVAALERRLQDGREWICGATLTMADVFWAVSLFRLKWIGLSFAWEGGHRLHETPNPRVQAYGRRLFERPTFREAVIDWPLTPRTEFVQDHYADRTP